MKKNRTVLVLACMVAGLFAETGVAIAQTSAAEMLEQARARAREMEELKAVLNGPDQNMRLASFDVMVNSGDEAMRQIAIDTGLASADPLMQAMAFKELVLSLNRIVMSLEIDKSQPAEIQAKSQAFLDAHGNAYALTIVKSDKKTGIFNIEVQRSSHGFGTDLQLQLRHRQAFACRRDRDEGPNQDLQGRYRLRQLYRHCEDSLVSWNNA